jgi:hypothetical protein
MECGSGMVEWGVVHSKLQNAKLRIKERMADNEISYVLPKVWVQFVRNVISGLGNRSDPRPNRGRLPCMTVDSVSRSATIKGGHAGAREPTFTVPTVPPQTLATQSDRNRHRHHVVLLVGSRYIYVIPRL